MEFKEEAKNTIVKYSLFSGLIFAFFVFLGVRYVQFFPHQTREMIGELSDHFSFILRMNSFNVFLFIFFNNSIKILIGMTLGVFFGIFPVFFTALNGFVVGIVAGEMIPLLGMSDFLKSIVPHGIFELPALFIGSGIGIFLGVTVIKEIKSKNMTFKNLKKFKFSKKLSNSFSFGMSLFFKIVVPLLFIAAIIETFLLLLY